MTALYGAIKRITEKLNTVFDCEMYTHLHKCQSNDACNITEESVIDLVDRLLTDSSASNGYTITDDAENYCFPLTYAAFNAGMIFAYLNRKSNSSEDLYQRIIDYFDTVNTIDPSLFKNPHIHYDIEFIGFDNCSEWLLTEISKLYQQAFGKPFDGDPRWDIYVEIPRVAMSLIDTCKEELVNEELETLSVILKHAMIRLFELGYLYGSCLINETLKQKVTSYICTKCGQQQDSEFTQCKTCGHIISELDRIALGEGQGDSTMFYRLGVEYGAGINRKKDYFESQRFLRKAIDAKYPSAKESLGILYTNIGLEYHNGKTVERSDEKALWYYKAALDLGVFAANLLIGLLYNDNRDYKKAFSQYNLCLNNVELLTNEYKGMLYNHLGSFYEYGYVVPVDMDIVKKYYELGSEAGSKVAQNNLLRLSEKSKAQNNHETEKPLPITEKRISYEEFINKYRKD